MNCNHSVITETNFVYNSFRRGKPSRNKHVVFRYFPDGIPFSSISSKIHRKTSRIIHEHISRRNYRGSYHSCFLQSPDDKHRSVNLSDQIILAESTGKYRNSVIGKCIPHTRFAFYIPVLENESKY